MSNIHPTAIVAPGANIASSASVGPYCVVGPEVELQENVILQAHVVIDGRTRVGARTTIYPFASIGKPPQDLKYNGEPTELHIGTDNVIREHVTMNTGTIQAQGKTVIGNHGLFMVGVHIAHDCVIGDHVIMANNATLGGHVQIGEYAVLGGLCAVHQFIRIGEFAMIGGMSGVESDVIPYGRVKGERAHLAGLNLVGMERRGFAKDQMRAMQHAVEFIFSEEGTLEDRLTQAEQDYAADVAIQKILQFARAKARFPLCHPPRKAA